jgi:DNA-binding protein YbaB
VCGRYEIVRSPCSRVESGGTAVTDEFEQLVRQFERFEAKMANLDGRFEQMAGMTEEIAELAGRASSADRSITVVAGPGGSIKEIQLTEEALAQGPRALGGAILTTLQQAVAEVARRQASVVEQYAGDDMNLLDQVLQTQAEAFGTTADALRSGMDAEPVSVSEEEDFRLRQPEPPRRPRAATTARARWLGQ